jgi:hypothetical protein
VLKAVLMSYAAFRFAECHYAEYRHDKCRYADNHYTEKPSASSTLKNLAMFYLYVLIDPFLK